MFCSKHIYSWGLSVSYHGKGLSTSSLAICKHRHFSSLKNKLYKVLNRLLINLLIVRVLIKNSVKSKVILLYILSHVDLNFLLLDDHGVLVNYLNNVLLVELDFFLIKRSFSYEHVDLGQLSHSLYLHVIIKIIILTLVLKIKRPFYIKIIMNKSERIQKLS